MAARLPLKRSARIVTPRQQAARRRNIRKAQVMRTGMRGRIYPKGIKKVRGR